MNEELEVLKEATQRLDKAGISYALSGSMAANYYTIPRMTRDMDIVVEMKNADVGRFVRSFKGDFFVDPQMVADEVKKRGMFNLIHSKYIIKIDFILRKESAWQESLFLRRRKMLVDKIPVWITSLEDLIVAKLLWAKDSLSEFQLNDVRNLLKSSGVIDRAYIEKWIKDLKLENVYKEVHK